MPKIDSNTRDQSQEHLAGKRAEHNAAAGNLSMVEEPQTETDAVEEEGAQLAAEPATPVVAEEPEIYTRRSLAADGMAAAPEKPPLRKDEPAPTAQDAVEQGCDGLTLSTEHANRFGLGKGLAEAINGLSSVLNGEQKTDSKNTLSSGGVERAGVTNLLDVNSPQLRGAADPEFMEQRNAARNRQFTPPKPPQS